MFALFSKEVSSFLNSLIGYVVVSVFLLITGLFMWVFPMDFNVLDNGYSSLETLFMVAPWVFLFLVPAVTMRSFAEENRAGTIELLLTKPLTEFQIVFAKFLSGFALVVLSVLPTLIYFISIYLLGLPKGNIDIGGTIGSYIGLLFLASTFTSVGTYCSAATGNQIVSFILAVFVSWFLLNGFDSISALFPNKGIDLFLLELSINTHYVSMSRGVLDTRDILYFISINAVFILGTRLVLEKRKW
ncbi:MAG: gliding motility-associated ABC transporter permease subunit GldF [Bacteroidia bacterium]|nr:gliding motility-associated ABC transporter permease subunit GldF [Bacteroidia bacterium]